MPIILIMQVEPSWDGSLFLFWSWRIGNWVELPQLCPKDLRITRRISAHGETEHPKWYSPTHTHVEIWSWEACPSNLTTPRLTKVKWGNVNMENHPTSPSPPSSSQQPRSKKRAAELRVVKKGERAFLVTTSERSVGQKMKRFALSSGHLRGQRS